MSSTLGTRTRRIMKHLKKINEEMPNISGAFRDDMRRFQAEEEQKKLEKEEVKGEPEQDISHWEIIIENGVPYLKVATDDDYYYVKMMCQKRFDRSK